MTLIETLVALGLLLGMLTLWHPVVMAMGQFTTKDAEILSVSAFEQAVQNQVAADEKLNVDGRALVIDADGRAKRVERYANQTDEMLRFISENGGHEPLLLQVRAIAWQAFDHAVKYHVTMTSGRIYEGVIIDGTKTW